MISLSKLQFALALDLHFVLISRFFFSKDYHLNIKKEGGLYGRDNKDHALSGHERG